MSGLYRNRSPAQGVATWGKGIALNAHALLRNGDDFYLPTASPDGRHLAFGAVESNANAWVIPHLPTP